MYVVQLYRCTSILYLFTRVHIFISSSPLDIIFLINKEKCAHENVIASAQGSLQLLTIIKNWLIGIL